MITASDLPVELHAEIVQNLHHYRDRPSLLATALVCKDWCRWSQRILFSAVTDHWHGNLDREDGVILTHSMFLQTIAEYPLRLGPLVHTYAQHHMACNPVATDSMLGLPNSSYELWVLTEKALPAMINLKHLYLNPVSDWLPARDHWASSRALLKSFTFKLETLSWNNQFDPQNGVPEFLAAQNNLLHLDVGRDPFWLDLSWLEDGVCPRLISISGGFESFIHVARSRAIVAWKWCPRSDTDFVGQSRSALDALKYLSVYNYRSFRDLIGLTDLKIEVLEIMEGGWGSNTMPSLSNLPNLRALVLIQDMYPTVVTGVILQDAVDCFNRMPSLQCVIVNNYGKPYWYLKISRLPGFSSRENVLQEELNTHYDVGPLWWTIYNI